MESSMSGLSHWEVSPLNIFHNWEHGTLGKWTERGNIKKDSFVKTSAVLFIFQIAIIHICGMIGLYIWSVSTGSPYTLTEVIMKGTVPFLFGDSIKAIILSLSMGFILKK